MSSLEINNNQLQMTELIRRKCEIESRISELGDILKAEGDVGMSGNLIDSEGYPHAHIDIYKIRLTRQEINCLQNDYKDLLKEIDERGISLTSENSEVLTKFESVAETPSTFLKITQVDAESPSALAGLVVNDEIVQFGPITATNIAGGLGEIAAHVKEREEKIVLMKVLRKRADQNQILRLKLVPKKWSGHGLLGCKLILI